MGNKRPQSQILAERGHRLPLALEARLAAHCVLYGDPAAGVVADAVAAFLDDFLDGIEERLPVEAAQPHELTYVPDQQPEPDLCGAAS